jgi:hypothetical protein
MVINHEEG